MDVDELCISLLLNIIIALKLNWNEIILIHLIRIF